LERPPGKQTLPAGSSRVLAPLFVLALEVASGRLDFVPLLLLIGVAGDIGAVLADVADAVLDGVRDAVTEASTAPAGPNVSQRA